MSDPKSSAGISFKISGIGISIGISTSSTFFSISLYVPAYTGPGGEPSVPGWGRSLGSVIQGLPSVVVTPDYFPITSGIIILSSRLLINVLMSSAVRAVLKATN